MANIMITERCNLRCSYCFANEFVGKSTEDISLASFMRAIDFSLTNPDEGIGIIGGEPTVHNQFREMLQLIIEDNRIKRCTLFTNGILIDEYVKELTHPKFSLLINCNAPNDIGMKQFEKTVKNISLFTKDYYMKDRITLGINMYKPNFEYQYLLELLKQHQFKYVRTSLSVPNTEQLRSQSVLDYFYEMKPYVLNFYHDALDIGVIPFYDCNAIPKCIFEEHEMEELRGKLIATGYDDRNLLSDFITCEPVIDILPDLSVIRCFAISEYEKAKISDFSTIFEAKAYFNNCFDTLAYHICTDVRCNNCYERLTMKCSGGCYAFKVNKMIECRNRIYDLNTRN